MTSPASPQLPFPEQIAAHCFFVCGHVERAESPGDVHRRMERHYAERHAATIAAIVGDAQPRTHARQAKRGAR